MLKTKKDAILRSFTSTGDTSDSTTFRRIENEGPPLEYNSLAMWLKRQKNSLTRMPTDFILNDLRKFAEQYGDIFD